MAELSPTQTAILRLYLYQTLVYELTPKLEKLNERLWRQTRKLLEQS